MGANCSFTFGSSLNVNNPTRYAEQVVWNFINATGLTLGTMVGGAVTNSNQIDGTLIAANFTGGGELHSYAFTGTLPASPVPVPPAALVFGAGLTPPGALRARRRDQDSVGQNGTPARLRLVRMVCSVCTRLTVGNPVSRCVS